MTFSIPKKIQIGIFFCFLGILPLSSFYGLHFPVLWIGLCVCWVILSTRVFILARRASVCVSEDRVTANYFGCPAEMAFSDVIAVDIFKDRNHQIREISLTNLDSKMTLVGFSPLEPLEALIRSYFAEEAIRVKRSYMIELCSIVFLLEWGGGLWGMYTILVCVLGERIAPLIFFLILMDIIYGVNWFSERASRFYTIINLICNICIILCGIFFFMIS